MLRIKSNCVLQELEKFGFERSLKKEEEFWCFNRTNYDLTLYVNAKTRQIFIRSGEYADCEDGLTIEPKLYDLIKAEMVEKVEEK